MKSIITILAISALLSGPAFGQSYGNNYGFDPSIQQRTHDMQQQQMQQIDAQRMHQDRMMQQQMQQQTLDQMLIEQRRQNMNNNYRYDGRY